ncbi:MAG: NAD(+)/NADH kinase [Acidimicrobiia bacterium]|nr:NAD(+)/NADH kinase [Acidimicrobiia bacterium]
MTSVRLITRPDRPEASGIEQRLRTALDDSDIAVSGAGEPFDIVIAIGGDGTVLEAAAEAMAAGVPVCGVNVGKVGYLAEFKENEIDDLVSAIAADRYDLAPHSVVHVESGDVSAVAVNDVVVEKVVSQRIIEVAVAVNGRPLATYRTDGIIVASPLGSTAYSLSAGGPVVDPSLDALILTPIAPHSLLTRPVVLAPDAVVTIAIEIERPARINVDGRELCLVQPGGIVTVQRGPTNVEFLSLGRHPFPQAVRDQFGLDHA